MFQTFFLFTFQFTDILINPVNAAEFAYKFHRCFWTDTWTTRNIIGCVAHKAQYINNLKWILNLKIFTNLGYTQNFHFVSHPLGFVHKDIFGYKLCIIFIRCYHKYLKALSFCCFCQCSNHIIRFEARLLDNRDIVPFDNLSDIRDRFSDIFGHHVALSLVFGKHIVTKCWTVKVEGYCNMGGILIFKKLLQRVNESEHRGGIKPFGVDTWCIDKCKVGAVNQRVGIKQKQSVHGK